VFLIASFGVFLFTQNLIQLLSRSQLLSLEIGLPLQGNTVSLMGSHLNFIATPTQLLIVISGAVMAVALSSLLRFARVGKAIRAVADDPIGASVVGIPAEGMIAASFFVGSVVAGAAGILTSLETNLDPAMGFNAVMKAIIASIIGGIGSIPGAVLGGIFLGLSENAAIYLIPAEWKDAVAFLVLIVFLTVRPSGILGSRNNSRY
jgi:branched-chain amino acid transport system permease protein